MNCCTNFPVASLSGWLEFEIPCKAFASCSGTTETALGLEDLVESQFRESVFSPATLVPTDLRFEDSKLVCLERIESSNNQTGLSVPTRSKYLREHFSQNPVNAFFAVSCNPVCIIICLSCHDSCEFSGECIQIKFFRAFYHRIKSKILGLSRIDGRSSDHSEIVRDKDGVHACETLPV
jgi:hypothetical protein